MKKILVSFGASLAFSAAAFAADQVIVDPAPIAPDVAGYSWSGAYIGVQGGYVFGNADHSFDNGAPSDDSTPDGLIGGVHIGYNEQFGSAVLGVEADIEAADVNGGFINTTGATSGGTAAINWQGSVRARLGYAMQNYMVYTTGGWAFGDFDFNGGPSATPAIGGYSETLHGWTVGAGVEAMFTRNWLGRLEYRYTDFGSASGTLAPGFPAVTMPVDVKTHAVRVGLSYKF